MRHNHCVVLSFRTAVMSSSRCHQDVVRGTNETSNLIRQEDQVMLRWPALVRRLARQSQFHCQSHKDNENETGSVWQIEFHCWSQLREGICLRGDLRDYNQISLPDQNRSSKWQPYHCAEFNFTNCISCECGRLREGQWDRFNFTADQTRRIQIRQLSKLG